MGAGELEALAELLNKQAAAAGKAARPSSSRAIPQGAATSVWAGVLAEARTRSVGKLLRGLPRRRRLTDRAAASTLSTGVRAYALDGESAKALWAKSEEWTGERF